MDTTIQTQIESIEEKSKQLAASQDLLKKTQVELQTMTDKKESIEKKFQQLTEKYNETKSALTATEETVTKTELKLNTLDAAKKQLDLDHTRMTLQRNLH